MNKMLAYIRRTWKTVGILALVTVAIWMTPAVAAERPSPGKEGPVMKGPIQPRPALLPDLVIASASVTPKCGGLGGTWAAVINATVKNQGPGTADLSKITWQIILAADWGFTAGEAYLVKTSVGTVKPSVGGPKTLKPGESWGGVLDITGIPLANVAKAQKEGKATAQFSFKVKADPGNGVPEANEENNEKLLYLPMTTCLPSPGLSTGDEKIEKK